MRITMPDFSLNSYGRFLRPPRDLAVCVVDHINTSRYAQEMIRLITLLFQCVCNFMLRSTICSFSQLLHQSSVLTTKNQSSNKTFI